MKHEAGPAGKRKAVNLSLDTGVVAAARDLGLNLSQVCEAALKEATKQARWKQWQEEHREAIAKHNAWVDKNGLPLERYRLF